MNNVYYQRPNNSRNSKKPQNPKRVNYIMNENVPVKEWIANVALVILSIVMAISIIALIGAVNLEGYHYERDADDFWSSMRYGEYSELVRMRWNNEALGVRETADLTQCYAAADYFESATLYKSAMHLGKMEDAKKHLEDMKEAYILLGDISYLTEDMNEMLGIESPVK